MKIKHCILIVDDTSSNIDVLASILTDYKVLVAKSGLAAMRIAKEQKPDLILLDVMMPEKDGFEVCKQMKSSHSTADIPIIFVTAKNQIEDEVKGLELGAVDFIHKPVSPPIVLARVKTQLNLIEFQKDLLDKNVKIERTLDELKDTQSRLIQNEKLVALGEIIAGVAHEINTPLGAIKSTNENLENSLNYFLDNFIKLKNLLNDEQMHAFMEIAINKDTYISNLSTKEEREKRKSLKDDLRLNNSSEFLPYIDELIGVGIFSYNKNLKTLKGIEDLDSVLNLMSELVAVSKSHMIMKLAIKKAQRIVKALHNYSRKNEFGTKTSTNLSVGIDTVLAIYQYKLKNSIKVFKYYIDDEFVNIYEDELNQVWTNLITNSLQAMDGEGTLEITIKNIPRFVKVSIKDNGKGIPDEVKGKIFDPFFTTKPKGKGTGIGLDIVRRIIKKHNGEIDFESEEGVGTCFNILIPR